VGADGVDTLRRDRGKLIQAVGAAGGEFLACDLVPNVVSVHDWKLSLFATDMAMFF
jgi:uncharacterized protein YecA (UPF0149 family)